MSKHIFKAIIWKEAVCFSRNSFLVVLFYIILLLGTNLFLPSLYIEEENISPWMNDLLLNNAVILSATLTVTVGSVIISQSMGLERREGILKVLLGMNLPADIIWLAQYIFSFVCSYILWLVSFLVYIMGVPLFYDIQMNMTKECLVLAVVVFPAVSALLLAVYAWLFWIAKNQTTQILYSMIPVLVYMASFYLNQAFAETKLQVHILAAVGLVLASLVGIIIARIIKHINAERLFDK